MKDTILVKQDLNKALLEQGFVVVDFCEPQKITDTFNLIEQQNSDIPFATNNNKNIDVTFHCTYLDHNKRYKQLVWEHLLALVEPFLEKNFIDYKIIQANLFNKAPGTGFISPHQNLTTVDEDEYTSVSIWVPIQNTSALNGTLHFAPKSHRKFEKYRNSNIHWAPMDASSKIEDYQMVPVNLNLGQALVFDDSIVHASPINKSDSNRYVFHYLAIPQVANPVFCKRTNTEVSLIKVDRLFWQTYTPGDLEPTEPVVKTKPYNPRVYTLETLLHELAN